MKQYSMFKKAAPLYPFKNTPLPNLKKALITTEGKNSSYIYAKLKQISAGSTHGFVSLPSV